MGKIKIRQLFQIFLAACMIALILRLFAIDSFIVKGDSMAPTILSGDYVFVDKISHYFKGFKRGDVIVVKPRSVKGQIIKRVIGLPGERIEITDDQVLVKNSREDEGGAIVETYIMPLISSTNMEGMVTMPAVGLNLIQLDPKEYFVLGDNRYISIDSRELGPVDEWNIKGRVFLVLRLKFPFVKILSS